MPFYFQSLLKPVAGRFPNRQDDQIFSKIMIFFGRIGSPQAALCWVQGLSDRFINFMDRFVVQATKIVILDNCPIYKSKKFMAKIEDWKEQDVRIYFLPPYSSELNQIEILWRRIKYQWLPFDAYLCFQNLKEGLSFMLKFFGKLYDIMFWPLLNSFKMWLIEFLDLNLLGKSPVIKMKISR